MADTNYVDMYDYTKDKQGMKDSWQKGRDFVNENLKGVDKVIGLGIIEMGDSLTDTVSNGSIFKRADKMQDAIKDIMEGDSKVNWGNNNQNNNNNSQGGDKGSNNGSTSQGSGQDNSIAGQSGNNSTDTSNPTDNTDSNSTYVIGDDTNGTIGVDSNGNIVYDDTNQGIENDSNGDNNNITDTQDNNTTAPKPQFTQGEIDNINRQLATLFEIEIYDPLVLDLNKDDKITITNSDTHFDYDGDNIKEAGYRISDTDGFLAVNRNKIYKFKSSCLDLNL